MNMMEVLFKVKDIMKRDFIEVGKKSDIKSAYNRMVEENKGEIILVDDEGIPIGMFTNNDLARMKRQKDITLEEYL